MATIAETERPTVVPAVAGVPFKLSWSAIFGGAFVLSSVDPSDPGSAKSAGIGTGIWSLIAPLIALFIGGFVAARTAGVLDKGGGALHGAVLWGLTTLAGVILMSMALSSLMGAVFSVGKTAVGAAGSAVVGAASQGGEAAKTFGLDANDALGPVNQRLAQEGKPTITADQLKAATSDVLNTAVRTGQLNRETLVSAIADNTKLSRRDAEDVATRVEQQFNQTKGQVQQKAGRAQGRGHHGPRLLGHLRRAAARPHLLGARRHGGREPAPARLRGRRRRTAPRSLSVASPVRRHLTHTRPPATSPRRREAPRTGAAR
jgi:hypothetical protein